VPQALEHVEDVARVVREPEPVEYAPAPRLINPRTQPHATYWAVEAGVKLGDASAAVQRIRDPLCLCIDVHLCRVVVEAEDKVRT